MVNIYEYNEIDFNHRGTPLKNFLKCEITEVLNGIYELNFEYPLESDDSHLLENGKILQVDNYDGKQLFRILYLQKDLDTIKGYALHISYDLLGNFIEDIYIQGMNGTRALQEVLNRSTDPHKFVGVSDITKLRNSRLVRKNTLEAIMGDKDNSLLSRWGGELYRDNFRINWLEKIGSDKGVTIKYAKNLTGIEYKVDTSNLVTHFIPKGFDGLLLPEKYVISPLANNYKPIVKRKVLELEDVVSKKVSPTQENAVDHEQALALLKEKANKAFENGADKPEITCTVAFIDLSQTEEYKNYAVLEKIYLGDTVGVQYKGINVLTRCVGYTYDCLQNRYIHVELGNTPQQNLLANAINNQQALITKIEEVERSNVEKAKEAIKDSLNDGLGSNIKYYTDRILIMDTNDEATAKVVWKFNSNGLSVSTTGVNGNFRLATTKDGKFFAEIITGLKINSEMIETGAIDFKHLSSTVFSKVREGLITETKLSEFLITNEGLKQKLTEEVQRQIETKKTELKGKDGTNSYIHMKYSNNANGQPMSDNSNSKYIGIYTGASKTPPTNASVYSWTMIKGVDGKLPNFNLLINSEMKDENSFKTNGGVYRLNKGDYNGKNSIEIINNNISSNSASLGVYFKSSKTSFKNGDKAVLRLPMYIYSDIPIDNGAFVLIKNEKTNAVAYGLSITNSMPRDKWFIIEEHLRAYRDFDSTDDYIFKIYTNKNGHLKIAEPYFALGDEIPKEWVPSLADLNTHSLTASVRINGSYVGAKTSGVKFFVEVFYDGKKVTDGFNLTAKVQGAGLNKIQENATYNSTGELTNVYYPDGDKDGTPITIQLDVEYNYTRTTCFARLDNLPSPELIEEVVKKYKTFESTIDKFESKIGEISKQKFKMAYNIENICSESGVEKKGNDLYFNAKTSLKKDKEYYVLADLEDVPDNQNTRLYYAKDNGDSKIITNGLNVWRVSYASDQTRVNIYPLGTNTKVKNVEIYEVPEFENPKENLIKTTNENFYNQGNIAIVAQEPLFKNDIYTLEFEVGNSVNGSMSTTFFNGVTNLTVKKPLVKGLNKLTIRGTGITNTLLVTIPNNLSISNVKFYKENFSFSYKTEYNISEMESKINQTKDQIEQSVKKNEFGTVLTQNAEYLRLAWNNISKYIQFENGGMSFYENGVVNQNKLTGRITDDGYQFWRDNNRIGSIGTQPLKDRPSNHGLNFNLAYSGYYMGWAYEDVVGESPKLKWYYTAKSIDSNSQFDNLNAGCDINMRGFYIKHVRFDLDNLTFKSGAVTNTFRFAVATGFSSDGSANYWYSNCYMSFKNGILISSNMPT